MIFIDSKLADDNTYNQAAHTSDQLHAEPCDRPRCAPPKGHSVRKSLRKLAPSGLALLACFAGSEPRAAAAGSTGPTARVAGAVTTFGSSLTGAVGEAVDSSQNVYVVTATGVVYKEVFTAATNSYTETSLFTVAAATASGIAVDTTGANIFVDSGTGTTHTVLRYHGSGTSYALASTMTGFTGTTTADVDASGNVYVADSSSGTLYKETLSGTTYTRSSIAAGLTTPSSVSVDTSGNIFVLCAANQIYKVSGSGTTYTASQLTISGLTGALSIAVDAQDDLFVQTPTELYEAALSGSTYTTNPYYQYTGQPAVLDTAGNIYLAAATSNTGTKLTVGSGYLNFGSVGPGAPAKMTVAFTLTQGGTLGTPNVVTQGLTGYDFTLGSGSTCTGATFATGDSCTVIVQFHPLASGSRLGAVNLLDSSNNTLTSSFLGGVGLAPLAVYQSVTLTNTISKTLSQGRGLTIDPAGNVFVANSTAGTILKFPAGSSTPSILATDSNCVPVGTAVDGEGNVFYTCNNSTNMYELVGGTGTPVAIPVGYTTDDHLSVDAAGNLYPTSYSPSNLFLKVAAGAHAVTTIATAPSGARFVGAVTDAAGNTFAPDYNNNILYELSAGSNTLKTLYTGSPLVAPHAIAEDAAGDLYVTITTPGSSGVGTSPILEFSASNYKATPATISVLGSDSIAVSAQGDIYTVYDNSFLYVYTRGIFSLAFPDTPVGQTSATQTVVLENDGTAPLTIGPPTVGTNPSISPNFLFSSSSTCPQLSITSSPTVLAAGATCTDVLQFSPSQTGSISGALVTTDDSANQAGSTQIIKVSATATNGTPTVTVAAASATLGQTVTLSATVTGGGVTPTGEVTFVVGANGSVPATCSADVSSETCTATYATAGLAAGANTITASYAGDSNYQAQTGTGTLTLAPAPTNSSVSSSPNPSTFGSSVTFTAQVTSSYLTPGGTVTFSDGSNTLGTASLNASGVATLSTANLTGGTHSITVSYGGAANYATSTSTPVNQVVNPVSGFANTLSSSNLTPSFGSSVTLTDTLAVLGGAAPTGTVNFYNGATVLGTASINSSGVATLITSALPVGTDTVTAKYPGDTNYAASTTPVPLTETVSKATPTSALSASASTLPFGGSVTLTDTLSISASTPPTGSVTFWTTTSNGPVSLGTVTLTNSGVVTLTTTALPGGSDSVTAVYTGDDNYNTKTSNAVAETVSPTTAYTNVLTSSNTTPTFTTSVTFTVTLSSVSGIYPTGSVTFLNGTTPIGTGTISATGTATLTTSTLPIGKESISVSYVGDKNFAASTSNALLENVANAPVSSDVLTSTNTSPSYGTSITLTDTLGPLNSTTYPTGTITFYNGSNVLGTASLSASGVATLTLSTLPLGTDTITAKYGGDTIFATATSNPHDEKVGQATGYSDVLTTSNDSPAFGTSVTLTDTIAAVNGTYPTGTVTFLNGSTPIGTGTLSATGVATLTTSALPAGTDSITAAYAGDTTFTAQTSKPIQETVAKATGYSDVLTSTNGTPAFGTSVTLTDTIPAVNGTYPTGTVTFFNGSTQLGTGTLSATGVATLSTSALPVGADSITAVYDGDTTFGNRTSNALPETVAPATAYSDVLTTSNASPSYGTTVTFTDTLGSVNGVIPTGTVAFLNNGTQIGTGTLNASGVATFNTSSLSFGADSITAVYAGDTTFAGKTSNTVIENVSKAPVSSNVLTTSNASPAFGALVTFADTLAAVNGTYPSGTVSFYNGTSLLGTGTLASGVATFTTSGLPAGSDSITASYNGDINFASATSNAVAENVAQATGYSDVLSTSNASPAFGASIALTDTIAAVNGTFPTGIVTFFNGSTPIGTGTLSATGVATLTTSALPAGTDSITASYAGDTTFAPETSKPIQETVAKATGYSDVLTSTNATPAFGASVTFTDTIPAVNGSYPSGTVTFFNGSTQLGTGTLSATGVATLTTSALPVGSDSITAVYDGDATFSNKTSNALPETVAPASGYSDVLTTSNANPTYGTTITFADTLGSVNGATPTGTVTFLNNGTQIGTGTLNASGVATFSTSSLPVDADSITAVYAGDTTFAGKTSNAIVENVGRAAVSSDTLSTSNANPTFGAPVTLTDTLGQLNGIYPSGTVTFYSGATSLGTGTLSASGVATLTVSTLAPTTDSITAVYAGDTNFATATSNTITENVGRASASNTLSSSNASPSFGTPVTFTDTLTPVGGVTPTGTVTFFNGANVLGTAAVSASGTASLTTASLPVGMDSVTAVYSGDTTFNASVSKAVSENVGVATGFPDVLTASTTTPSFGQSVTFTNTLGSVNGVTPTGTVTFSSNGVSLGTSTLSASGIATFSTSSLSQGLDTITAVYAGDTSYGTEPSNALSVNVGKAPATTNDTVTGSGTYGAANTAVTVTIPYSGPVAATGTISLADTHGNTVSIQASTCTASNGKLTCSANLPTANEPAGSNTVSVSQAADTNYSGSTGSGTVTINKVPLTSGDTATGTSTYGSTTTAVTVNIPFSGPTAPIGLITLTDSLGGTVNIAAASCTASATALSCSTNLPTANDLVGSNTVTVNQAPDSNYSGSTGSGTITITKAPATTNDTATGTGTYGSATTPVTVTVPYIGAVAPTATITIADAHSNTVTIATSGCTSSGSHLTCTANLPSANLAVGTDAITITQLGDSNYAGSTGSGTVTINKASSTGADTATGTGSYGAPTTLVKVTIPYTGASAPTGAITVSDAVGDIVTVAASTCTAAPSALTCIVTLSTFKDSVGANAVTVSQAADNNYAISTGTGTITLTKASLTNSDTASGTGTYGAPTTPVTVSIPFAGALAPKGEVTVTDTHGNTTSVSASTCTAATGALACTINLPTTNEPVGTNNITVSQADDANYLGSTGTGTISIGKAAVTNTDTATGVGSYGSATTSVIISIPYAGTTAPTGAITVADTLGNTVTIAASACSTSGGALTCTAILSTANEPVGSNALSISQAGDDNYTGSTGSGAINMNPAGASNGDSAVGTGSYGAPSTPVTVIIPYKGSTSPTGAITVADTAGNTITIAASSCSASGGSLVCSATLPTANEPVGINVLTVAQAADANHATSTGAGTITINKAAATTTDTATGNGVFGAQNTLVTVTIPYIGSAAPTGAVTVTDSLGNTVTVPASVCSAASQTLTCTVNLPSTNDLVGNSDLAVAQAGDANYMGSTGTGKLTIATSIGSPLSSTSGGVQNVTITQGTASTLLSAVLSYDGSIAPTGAVTFSVTGGAAVPASCSAGPSPIICTATYATAALQAGTYVITANEAADANYVGGSATGTLTVSSGTVSPLLDSISNVSNVLVPFGTVSATFTANITYSGPLPTGVVTFNIPGGTAVTATCTSGASPLACTATYPTVTLPVGTYVITATDAADANYPQGSASALLTIEANATSPVSPVVSSGSNVSNVLIPYGTSTTTLTANIVYSGPAPTGAASFTIGDASGTTVSATCTTGASPLTCTALYPTAALGIGSYRIQFNQAADTNYPAGTAIGTLTVTNVPASNGDSVTGTGTYGAPTTPITVTIPFIGTIAPTGSISVTDTANNTVSIAASACTAANGALTCSADMPTANVPASTDAATVSQTADAIFGGSTGNGSITINKAPATNSDTATGTGTYGAATTTLSITIPYAGPAAPTGAVTVTDSLGNTVSMAQSTCTAASGTLTCAANLPTANEPLGSNTVTISQAADANYSGSTGSGTVTINKAAGGNDTATGTGTYGAATTAVTITIPYAGPSAPTGPITIADTYGNTLTIQPSTCSAAKGTLTCSANLATANEPVGANSVTVAQPADADYNASTGTGTVTINKAPATIADAATGTAAYGAPTAAITINIPYAGSAAPTGAITVSDIQGNTITIAASTCTAANGALTCTANLPISNLPAGPDQLTITQAPDANYAGSTGTGSVTITKATTPNTDTATGTATYGATTAPITVTIPYTGSTAPTGAITVADTLGNTATAKPSTCTAAKNALTCIINLPTANDTVGSNTLSITQAADTNYAATTGSGTLTINKAPATTGDTATGSSDFGAATTSVTITIPYAGAAAPTGAITIADTYGNTLTIQPSTCSAAKGTLTCTANLPTANEPRGTNTVTITQAPDANYSGSTGSGSLSIGKSTPTLAAPSISPLNTVAGTSVTITETVPTGETGTVTFSNGSTTLGTVTIANGIATLTTSALPAGTDSITATANGDNNYATATSPAVADTITAATSNVVVTSSASTSTFGASVTFTAAVTVTGTNPANGTITFYDGTNAIGTANVSSGSASVSTSTLSVGSHTITASFTPASGAPYAAASSAPITQTVAQIGSTVALTSSANPATLGASVTFTASVTVTGTNPASGSVTFYDGTTPIGTANVSSGFASVGTSALGVGSHSITASFTPAAGSAFGPATSAPITQTVAQIGSTVALTSSANPAIVGQSVTFSAGVPVTTGGAAPTGSVTFLDGTTVLGTAPLNASGVATYTTSTLKGGVHNLTAVYAGDSNYNKSTSAVVAQQVSDFTLGTSTATAQVNAGSAATFNVSITPLTGTSFAAPVALTVTGLPSNYTSGFAPGSLTPGSKVGSSVLSIQTAAQVVAALEHQQHTKGLETAALWALLFPLLGLRRIRRRLPKALLMLLLSLASFGVVAPLTGCGGGYFAPQSSTYTLTITGTSGTLQRSTTVTLNVR